MWPMLFATAIRSLRGNLLRSLLAMAGVVIGVAAVIAMLAVGAGAERKVLEGFSKKGAEVLFVFRDWRNERGRIRFPRPLTLGDARALAALPPVAAAAPIQRGQVSARAGGRNASASVVATTDAYFACTALDVAAGRLFGETEADLGLPVAVLGATVAGKLFPERDAVGETVLLGPLPFRVVGVLAEQGRQGFFDPDGLAIVPLAAARRGVVAGDDLDQIQVLARSLDVLADAEERMGRELLRRHRLLRAEDRDFAIYPNKEMIEQVREFTTVFAALLAGVAAISLLVGGIGIMNIMLVAVTERTREIGLRKAIGARERDIRRQFLLEAVLVTTLGGALGVAVGWGLVAIAAMLMPFAPVVQPAAVLLALGFSAAVGLFFGYYPARRAARLDPIEALRHE